MKEYAFDVKLYAVIPIKAPDRKTAEATLAAAMDSAELSISISENDGTVTSITASAYVDDIEFPFLTEVDGIPIEDIEETADRDQQ